MKLKTAKQDKNIVFSKWLDHHRLPFGNSNNLKYYKTLLVTWKGREKTTDVIYGRPLGRDSQLCFVIITLLLM